MPRLSDGLFFSDSRGASKAFHDQGAGMDNIDKAFDDAGFTYVTCLPMGTSITNSGHKQVIWSDKIVLCKKSSTSLIQAKIKSSGLTSAKQFAAKILRTPSKGKYMSPEDFA